MTKKTIVEMMLDFEGKEDNPNYFTIPKHWGKEFEHKKEINNKGWIFELTEIYKMFEGDLDSGGPGRYGIIDLDLIRTPGKTLAEELYNDKPTLLRHTEKVGGDDYRLQIIPIVDFIHLIYNSLEKFAKSQNAIKVYEARLNKMYENEIADILEYGNSHP
jgi:hypothetical protein